MQSELVGDFLAELLQGGAPPSVVAAQLRASDEADGTRTELTDEHAAAALMAFFKARPREVFYDRQLAVTFEKLFFHWMTGRVLRRLARQGQLATDLDALAANPGEMEEVTIRFYRLPTHRFWKTEAKEIKELVQQFSTHTFGKALGKHAEMLFDAGMARVGFMPIAENVKEFQGRTWPGGKNLDRLYQRDGVVWGTEIKNKLKYIERGEFEEKIRICRWLGVKPLFINREMPRTYIKMAFEAGGYCLIFGYQFYPYGQEAFAERVRTRLGLPIGMELARTTVERFLDWHVKQMPKNA